MQKERPVTPKLRQTKRIRSALTPDRLRSALPDTSILGTTRTTSFRSRMTMAPSEFAMPQGLVTKRGIGEHSRQSIMPSLQLPLQIPMKFDLENADDELDILYSKYLQTVNMDILMNDKIQEQERLLTTQLASIDKEKDLKSEKLSKAKLNENEIRRLSMQQNIVDAQIIEADSCIDDLGKKNKVREKLLELKTIFEPLDQLRCKGIIIPEDNEGLDEVLRILKESSDTLKMINDSIGPRRIMHWTVKEELNNFIEKQNEIKNVHKKFEEVLCSLQVLVLKEASHTLDQTDVE